MTVPSRQKRESYVCPRSCFGLQLKQDFTFHVVESRQKLARLRREIKHLASIEMAAHRAAILALKQACLRYWIQVGSSYHQGAAALRRMMLGPSKAVHP